MNERDRRIQPIHEALSSDGDDSCRFRGNEKKTALTTNSHEQFTENKNWAKRNSILFDIAIPLDKVAIIRRVCNRLNLGLSIKTKHVINNPKFHGTTALKMSKMFPALKFWFIFFLLSFSRCTKLKWPNRFYSWDRKDPWYDYHWRYMWKFWHCSPISNLGAWSLEFEKLWRFRLYKIKAYKQDKRKKMR